MLFLMSTSTTTSSSSICCISTLLERARFLSEPAHLSQNSMLASRTTAWKRRRPCSWITRANEGKRTWWQKFFFDEEGNWLGLKDNDLDMRRMDDEENEEEAFEAWKRRAEAISELRQAQQDVKNAHSRAWEDWLQEDDGSGGDGSSWGGNRSRVDEPEAASDPSKLVQSGRMAGALRNLVLGSDEDDLLLEDRIFRYASSSSAKFLVLLALIPWILDFVVHDCVLLPFLDRYVKTVPLAAEMLDVRRSQKLEMIKTLEIDKARLRFEVEIGKSPPLSDEEVLLELRHKAKELRDHWRLENRKAFANIWSDMVFGVALFILMYFNQSKVALLKFAGYKILNNISDTGKAFLIILVTDIFLGSVCCFLIINLLHASLIPFVVFNKKLYGCLSSSKVIMNGLFGNIFLAGIVNSIPLVWLAFCLACMITVWKGVEKQDLVRILKYTFYGLQK